MQVSQLRNVDIEDLLRREPVQTDVAAIRELIAGKRVLITGGGGSIGSELCRQIFDCRPAELALVGHGENSIFSIHGELCQRAEAQNNHDTVVTAYIGDVRFPERLKYHLPGGSP